MTTPDLPELPELREPDLPRTMKVRPKALRTGWTTGTCTAAAARAAVTMLSTGVAPATVEVLLPAGTRAQFLVESCIRADDGTVTAVVVKDAGDDPDVTHGAHLTATVSWVDAPGLVLEGGKGVGTVTKAGLGLEVGAPAINPVPRRMISANVAEVVDLTTRGVRVQVSVPGGEVMARKTTNRRLGILGGISILGTTGIVRPFSTASWRASVVQAIDVMAAQGERTLVLSTGGRTEKAAVRLLPDLPEVCFVEVGDFTGAALQRAVERGLADVVFVGMVGKLTKLASGVLMTHYTRSKVDPDLLAALTASGGGGPATVEAVRGANSARHAYEMWSEAGILRACGDLLCGRVAEVLAAFSEARLAAEVCMVDFDGHDVVAGTGRWAA